MTKITLELLRDINKDTIDFLDNYDGTEREPEVLPSCFLTFSEWCFRYCGWYGYKYSTTQFNRSH